MSRVAKLPIPVPSGVEVDLQGRHLTVKGSRGRMELDVHPLVEISHEDGMLKFSPRGGVPDFDGLIAAR